jgi:hypothetical protein
MITKWDKGGHDRDGAKSLPTGYTDMSFDVDISPFISNSAGNVTGYRK